jgi:Resolvase, N terminal domain
VASAPCRADIKNFDKNLAPMISRAHTRHKLWSKTHPEKSLIGYVRVSTYGQTLDSQLEQLRAAGCNSRNIYREKVTGAKADRRSLTGCSASSTPATW